MVGQISYITYRGDPNIVAFADIHNKSERFTTN